MVKPGFRIRATVVALLFGLAACSRDLENGDACLALGDYPLAIRFFSRAVERDPSDYPARVGLGKALIQKSAAEGDSSAFAYALVQLEAARSLRPGADMSGLLGDAHLEKARRLLGHGDTVPALASLAKSLEIDPGRTGPLNLAGIVYARLGDADRAAALFQKALALDSGSASAHFNLGMLSWQTGDFRKAHAHWLRALRLLPRDEDVLYWFAMAEKRLREAP